MQDFVNLAVVKDGAPGTLEANVLSLRNIDNEEVAGLSGLPTYDIKEFTNEEETESVVVETVIDNVLLWSGGTLE
jgi:hypothetical protein